MKICKKCNKNKDLMCFHKSKRHRDGLNSSCKECVNNYKLEHRIVNRKKYSEYSKKWALKNKEKVYKYQCKWNSENPNKIKEKAKKFRENNKEIRRYYENKRRAAKLQATLPNYEDEIKEIYKNCPNGHHVDHIIPLNNSIVCGLHVPWNLQHLPAEENLKKSNKLQE